MVQRVSKDDSEVHSSKRAMLRTSAIVAAASTLGMGSQVGAATPKAAASRTPGKFWPDGLRLVISVSMPFEAGAQSEHNNGSPFPAMDTKYPDLPARTWFEYGVREGIPRMLDLWDRHGVKVTSHMTGQAVERNPQLAKEIVDRGHEAAAHGQTWTPHWTMTPDEEKASYVANMEALFKATGTRPVGYNAFWLRGTPRTLPILQELGFTYHTDDLSRDEPMTTQINGKPFAVVPYTLRMNDIARYGAEGPLTAAAFGQELKDEFDQLYIESAGRRRMMMLAAHDRITGTPARVKVLGEFLAYAKKHAGVAFVRKDQIARWALEMPQVPTTTY